MKSTLASLAEMWPLLCIGLVLALIAGFFVWILDTWHNQDEFPRPFLIGVFEGFWWSFISMTTVGELYWLHGEILRIETCPSRETVNPIKPGGGAIWPPLVNIAPEQKFGPGRRPGLLAL